jgi:hypothetical protein
VCIGNIRSINTQDFPRGKLHFIHAKLRKLVTLALRASKKMCGPFVTGLLRRHSQHDPLFSFAIDRAKLSTLGERAANPRLQKRAHVAVLIEPAALADSSAHRGRFKRSLDARGRGMRGNGWQVDVGLKQFVEGRVVSRATRGQIKGSPATVCRSLSVVAKASTEEDNQLRSYTRSPERCPALL